MFALTHPDHTRVFQVEAQPFEVTPPLAWIECADDVTPQTHKYEGGQFALLPPVVPPTPSITSQILALEATITERRKREAILTQEGRDWLTAVDAQIATLRGQL
jgi:hypothetical protein